MGTKPRSLRVLEARSGRRSNRNSATPQWKRNLEVFVYWKPGAAEYRNENADGYPEIHAHFVVGKDGRVARWRALTGGQTTVILAEMLSR